MDLENVCGMIIGEDGISHSFGIKKMAYPDELGPENYHNGPFLEEIYNTEWFQEANVPFDKKKGVLSQLDILAAHGFTTICNASSLMRGEEPYYSYFINMPINPSDNVRNYLSSIYEDLKALIKKNQAYFEAYTYNENGNYAGTGIIFSLDELYDTLGIAKGKVNSK